jgi:arylsulfate sulfotransferase
MVFVLLAVSSCGSTLDYTIETTLNPNKISPLTAMLSIEIEKPCTATIEVLGKSPIKQSFEANSTYLEIPVVGLYPNITNNVVVTLKYDGGTIVDTVKIKTSNIPTYFPEISINKINRNEMEPGLHACDIHFANNGKFNSVPMIFDDQGKVRWYLDLSFAGKMVSPFQRLKDGTILMVSRHVIYEFDMLGKPLKETNISTNYGMHHDVLELPDGNLLICIGKRGSYINLNGDNVVSDSDFIMLFDRKNSKIINEWDLAKHLDVSLNQLNFFRPGDFLHMNGLAFDKNDHSIIVSGKNLGLMKISWNDKLQWIMSPIKSWGKAGRDGKGFDTKPYLLTAIDSIGQPFPKVIQNGKESSTQFDFPWGQHAPNFMPNGNLLLFDNGVFRNFENNAHYSRAVEYNINEKEKTVKQIWQYGKERRLEFFSTIVSDVDYLQKSDNVLITSGFIKNGTHLSAKIVEVDYNTSKEIFEATLNLKSEKGNKTSGWGQTDILYRSERIKLQF